MRRCITRSTRAKLHGYYLDDRQLPNEMNSFRSYDLYSFIITRFPRSECSQDEEPDVAAEPPPVAAAPPLLIKFGPVVSLVVSLLFFPVGWSKFMGMLGKPLMNLLTMAGPTINKRNMMNMTK